MQNKPLIIVMKLACSRVHDALFHGSLSKPGPSKLMQYKNSNPNPYCNPNPICIINP